MINTRIVAAAKTLLPMLWQIIRRGDMRSRSMAIMCLAGLTGLLLLPLKVANIHFNPAVDRSGVLDQNGTKTTPDSDTFQNQINTGDLASISATGKLRVLVEKNNGSLAISPVEKQLLTQFADSLNLQVTWIPAADPEKLTAMLNSGYGDVLAATRYSTATGEKENIRLTLPWVTSRQQIIGRTGMGDIHTLDDLLTRQLALKQSSPAWASVSELANRHKGMGLIAIPENVPSPEILRRVDRAQYDLAIIDSVEVEHHLADFFNLEVLFNFSEDKSLAWATRQDSVILHESLNQFLNKKHLEVDLAKIYRDDLPKLKSRKLLRLITYRSPVNYYFDRGKLKGFEYDLVKRFAAENGMRLDVIIARSHEQMLDILLAGKGDLIAASLPQQSYYNEDKIAGTTSYSYAAPVLVGRTYDSALVDIRELAGRRIALAAESPYRKIIQELAADINELEIVDVSSQPNTESILFGVAQGFYDLTVIGSHELKPQLARQLNLKTHFNLTEPLPHSWVVRKTNTTLLSALNNFIKKEYRKRFYNIKYAKYIEKPNVRKGNPSLLASIDRLSPYDEIVYKYAELYDFDWRLIVAQMFQESQFDPQAVSYAGAEGLMQIIPDTAELLGINNLNDPDESINAGIRYLAYLRNKLEEDILLEDRTWFTLAAYNAGYNRVKRARDLAEKMNLDRDKWFDNVERAMLALSRPYDKDGETLRYCKCGQAVIYVREIKTLYNNYVRLTETANMASIANVNQEEI